MGGTMSGRRARARQALAQAAKSKADTIQKIAESPAAPVNSERTAPKKSISKKKGA